MGQHTPPTPPLDDRDDEVPGCFAEAGRDANELVLGSDEEASNRDDEIISLHEGALHGARAAGRSPFDSEDLAQQVVTDTLERTGRLEKIDNKRSYGRRAGYNQGVNEGKRKTRQAVPTDLNDSPLPRSSAAPPAETEAMNRLVARELFILARKELTSKQWEDFKALAEWGDMGDAIKALSRMTCEPDQNIRKRLGRAVNKLRDNYDDMEGGEQQ